MNMSLDGIYTKKIQPRISSDKFYKRNRLFKLLDKAREKSAIWVNAMAGSGKTVLVASYIDSRNINALWYQLDEHDNDAGSFFFNFSRMVKEYMRDAEALPVFDIAHMPALERFISEYAESLFLNLEKPFTMVFDDYHHIAENSVVNKVLSVLIEKMPSGGNVIFISRNKPGAEFVNAWLEQDIHHIAWEDLKLELNEIQGVSKLFGYTKKDEKHIEQVHAISHGWMAAAILMLSSRKENSLSSVAPNEKSASMVFEYLAHKFFSSLSEAKINFYVKLSVLKKFTLPMAKSLTEDECSSIWLAEVDGSGFFVKTCVVNNEIEYELHPLYREFLQMKLREYCAEENIRELKLKAASVMSNNNYHDNEIELLSELGEWQLYIDRVNEYAESYINDSMHETLFKHIKRIPGNLAETNGWINYWSGICCSMQQPPAALTYFESAYHLAEQNNNKELQHLAWSAVAESLFVQWDKYTLFDLWLKKLDSFTSPDEVVNNVDLAGKVLSGVMGALLMTRTSRKVIEPWLLKAEETVFALKNPGLQFMLVSKLVYYHFFMGDIAVLSKYVDILSHHVRSGKMPAVFAVAGMIFIAEYSWLVGDHEQWKSATQKYWEEVKASNLFFYEGMLHAQDANGSLAFSEIKAAEMSLEKLAGCLNPGNPAEYGYYYNMLCWHSALKGDFNMAAQHGLNAVDFMKGSGAVFPIITTTLMYLSSLFQSGRREDASSLLQELYTEIIESCSYVNMFQWYSLDTFFCLETGNEDGAKSSLEQALQVARNNNLVNYRGWEPALMSRLCGYALLHGIETDYARRIILQRNLVPLPEFRFMENWPWKLRIYSLGSFRIETGINHHREQSDTEIKGKPLELLKAMISLGAKDIDEEYLATEVWPDMDGDEARRSLTVTLHRLRKLLGDNQMITLQNGKLSINTEYCWIDTLAFDTKYSELLNVKNQQDIDISQYKELIQMNTGSFMKGENMVWMLAPRERYRTRIIKIINMVRTIICKGDACNAYNCDTLSDLISYGLELDELCEDFYQARMQCSACRGNSSEGIRIFEQCKLLLHKRLGIDPSSQTLALLDRIRNEMSAK